MSDESFYQMPDDIREHGWFVRSYSDSWTFDDSQALEYRTVQVTVQRYVGNGYKETGIGVGHDPEQAYRDAVRAPVSEMT